MKDIFETIEPEHFFNRDAQIVAKDLLGKVLQHKVDDIWVSGMESINQFFKKITVHLYKFHLFAM